MSILPDHRIRSLANAGMIEPFCDRLEREGVISYGLSSFGYDIRCAREWKIFVNAFNTVVDPKGIDQRSFVDFDGDEVIIPPNSFVLARSLEYIRMPENVMGLVLGKSTYARCGISCLATPLEPGWEGHITLEFANSTPLPAKMYALEGCAQLLFFEGERPEITYADRKGKYQGQTGVTLPRL
jgi:dCTP deaminase